MLIASVPFAMGVVSSSLAAVFQVRLQLGRGALADAAGRVGSLLALLAVVAADLGFAAVVASMAAGAAVTLALTVAFARRLVRVRPAADRAVWRELALAAVPLGLTLAVAELYFRADTFILSLSRDVDEVGRYALAYRLYELLGLLPAMVMASVYPLLSRQLAADRAAAQRTLDATARAFAAFGLPLAAGGLVIAPELARLAGGDEFARRRGPAAAAALRRRARLPLRAARLRADRRRARARDAVARRVAALVLNLGAQRRARAGLRRDGLGGDRASAARRCCSAAAGCSCAAGSACARRWAARGAPRVAAAVMAAAVWPLRDRTPALTVPLGAAVYGAALWALGGIDRRTLEALRG